MTSRVNWLLIEIEMISCNNILRMASCTISLQGVTARQEWCQTILAASQFNTLCEPVGNCTGLMCLLQGGNFDGSTASFQVRKCQDPVVVDLMITSSDGTVGFQREFNSSQTVFDVYHSAASGQGVTINVTATVARNATHLNFSVSMTL